MTINNAFATSILGMMSQTQALGTISQNIANATSGGYKRTETRFQTVLSQTLQHEGDLGGVIPIDSQMIDRQGIVLTTARELDLAISGDGFFVVSTALTGGETYYTRDGSFEMRLETPGTGSGAATTAPGYLVDRNGYYLLGYAPDANGVFPTSGTPEPMRVDADFFQDVFEATTMAEVSLNLPASAPFNSATRQVNSITLAGTIEGGDVYSVTVGGTTVSYTTTGAEASIDDVRDNLITQINAAAGVNVTASATTAGVIRLSADTAGTPFTASATAVDGGGTADNTATSSITTANVTAAATHATVVANADSGLSPDGFHSYSISVVDSEGDRQPIRLNFTRSALNTWQLSVTHSRTPVAQVDTVTLGGVIHAGDVYTVNVAGSSFTYTATGAEAGLNAVRDDLITQINAATNVAVTAAAGAGIGVITLTADTAGTSFTSSASANDTSIADNTASIVNTVANAVAVQQVNTATLAGTIEAGDVYTTTINGIVFTYTVTAADVTAGDDMDDVAGELITLINANVALPVTATAGALGEIVLTADVAGVAFVATVGATNVGGGTATDATTTANTTDTTTSAAVEMVFNGKGALSTITDGVVSNGRTLYNFDLTFNGGSTATFDFDVTNITQFDTGFVAISQNINGFEASDLRSLTWDQDGFLIGTFNSESSRRLYKVPLANFVSPNNLTMKNGMVFAESALSGAATIEDPKVSGRASFSAGAIESSNVDIAQEFTRMIQTQAVYNANALAFRTNDEMTVTARDLTRA